MDIAEVAAQSGVAPSALRYYEKIDLIRSTGRNGLRRQYDPDVLHRLALISMGKTAGFALDEIAAMFRLTPTLELPRAEIAARAAALEEEIARLETLARMMRHVASCPEENHMDCPRFRTMLRASQRALTRS
ncbi:MerR family transcriptional regulator [Dinoroseobacter sp. S124A]|uniref:MerR family transcriptional regulator n=1 Tax=Dinoroseobacter sp. S124A TaxID=3415128 RepID=UPI003C7D5E03